MWRVGDVLTANFAKAAFNGFDRMGASPQTGRRETLVRARRRCGQSEGKTVLNTLAKAEETALRREKTGGSAWGTSCPPNRR